MRLSLRTKLVLIFLAVIAASGVITVLTGINLIGNEIVERAQARVRLDLNSARAVYDQRLQDIAGLVRINAQRFFLRESLASGRLEAARPELERIRVSEGLDILSVTDAAGNVLFRAGNPEVWGDSQAADEIVGAALASRELVAATQLMPADQLALEGEDLADRARVPLVETPMARPRPEALETNGMLMKAAVPILDASGSPVGILYGGKLLSRDYRIVDDIKEILYEGESHRGSEMGTVTIFQDDLRISTNVLGADGRRAVGTRVSREVYDRVMVAGAPYVGKAFVVNQWYITAYEPIKSLAGENIGMLYVGLPERPYVDLKRRIALTFAGISTLTFILLSAIVYAATSNVMKPLRNLLEATQRVARGYLAYRVEVTSEDELGQLASSFNSMTEQLEITAGKYASLTQTLEERVRQKTEELRDAQEQLIQSEKLTSLGKMAAGIAHEINNPLTSILLNIHLLTENMERDGESGENLRLILDETERCSRIVKGLLDFSRQSPAEKIPVDVNKLVEDVLNLMKSHILASRVKVDLNLAGDLALVHADPDKIKQVVTNLIHNAIEAMPDGGTLSVTSKPGAGGGSVEMEFADTGCGIPGHLMTRIFDPFFSTKKGRGTGLGLSISYGIVEQHGGNISVASEVDRGTTVTVSLPVKVSQSTPRSGDERDKTAGGRRSNQ